MKKTAFIFSIFLLISFFAKANLENSEISSPEDTTVYALKDIEKFPAYPGGENALIAFINQDMHYPKKAMKENIQGKVIVSFVVEKDGSVSQVTVKKGIVGDDGACNNEAIRVVKKLARFSPGMQNGKPVRVYYMLPINFKLAGDEGKKGK